MARRETKKGAQDGKKAAVVLLCDPGAEEMCKAEAARYGLPVVESMRGVLIAEQNAETAIKAVYRMQTCLDALLLLGRGKTVAAAIKSSDAKLPPGTFAARTHIIDEQTHAQSLNEETGEAFKKLTGMAVDLENPTMTVVPVKTEKEFLSLIHI